MTEFSLTRTWMFKLLVVGLVCLTQIPIQVNAQYEGIFCGKQTCYEVLEVEPSVDAKGIRKAYRKMQMEKHPDRMGKLAETEYEKHSKIFHQIRTAYEILKDETQRKEYDHLLANPTEMYSLWYKEVGHRFQTSVDPTMVVILFLAIVSVAQFYLTNSNIAHKINAVLDNELIRTSYVKKAIADGKEDLVTEGKKKKPISDKTLLKQRLLEIYGQQMQEELGLEKVDVTDLFFVRALKAPYTIPMWMLKNVKFYYDHSIMKKPYSSEEKVELTWYTLGMTEKKWKSMDQDECTSLVKRELWVYENYRAFKDEQQELLLQQSVGKKMLKNMKRHDKRNK